MKELSNIFIGPNGLVCENIYTHPNTEIIGVIPVKDIPVSKLHFIHQHLDIEFDLDGYFFVGHNNNIFII